LNVCVLVNSKVSNLFQAPFCMPYPNNATIYMFVAMIRDKLSPFYVAPRHDVYIKRLEFTCKASLTLLQMFSSEIKCIWLNFIKH